MCTRDLCIVITDFRGDADNVARLSGWQHSWYGNMHHQPSVQWSHNVNDWQSDGKSHQHPCAYLLHSPSLLLRLGAGNVHV